MIREPRRGTLFVMKGRNGQTSRLETPPTTAAMTLNGIADLSPADERQFIIDNIRSIERATGQTPKG